jgi:hypothetical protein
MSTMRDLTAAGAQQQSQAHPNSWLAQQRSNVCDVLWYAQPRLMFPDSLEHTSGDNLANGPASPVFINTYTSGGTYRTFLFSRNIIPGLKIAIVVVEF